MLLFASPLDAELGPSDAALSIVGALPGQELANVAPGVDLDGSGGIDLVVASQPEGIVYLFWDPAPGEHHVSDADATGRLKQMYDAAIARAGRVFEIVRTMSPNPPVLEKSMAFYSQIMKGKSGLSRKEREMLATVTSAANDCYY